MTSSRTENWEWQSPCSDSSVTTELSTQDLLRRFDTLDVLICGKCLKIFHFVEEFCLHKSGICEEATETDFSLTEYALGEFLWKNRNVGQESKKDPKWSQLDDKDKRVWILAGKSLKTLRQAEKQIFPEDDEAKTFPQEPTVATLAPVIPKASKRIGKKFRGPGGMFASVSKQKLSTFPLKKVPSDAKPKIFRSHAESSEIGQEYLTRPKRKSLVKALDLVKEWTSDKSSNYFNNTKFSSPGKRTSSSPPVKKLKKGKTREVEEIILGGTGGPSTLLEAAKRRNLFSQNLSNDYGKTISSIISPKSGLLISEIEDVSLICDDSSESGTSEISSENDHFLKKSIPGFRCNVQGMPFPGNAPSNSAEGQCLIASSSVPSPKSQLQNCDGLNQKSHQLGNNSSSIESRHFENLTSSVPVEVPNLPDRSLNLVDPGDFITVTSASPNETSPNSDKVFLVLPSGQMIFADLTE